MWILYQRLRIYEWFGRAPLLSLSPPPFWTLWARDQISLHWEKQGATVGKEREGGRGGALGRDLDFGHYFFTEVNSLHCCHEDRHDLIRTGLKLKNVFFQTQNSIYNVFRSVCTVYIFTRLHELQHSAVEHLSPLELCSAFYLYKWHPLSLTKSMFRLSPSLLTLAYIRLSLPAQWEHSYCLGKTHQEHKEVAQTNTRERWKKLLLCEQSKTRQAGCVDWVTGDFSNC